MKQPLYQQKWKHSTYETILWLGSPMCTQDTFKCAFCCILLLDTKESIQESYTLASPCLSVLLQFRACLQLLKVISLSTDLFCAFCKRENTPQHWPFDDCILRRMLVITAFFSLTVEVRYSWSRSSRNRRSSTINSSMAERQKNRITFSKKSHWKKS